MHRLFTGLLAAILAGLCMGQGCAPTVNVETVNVNANDNTINTGDQNNASPGGGDQQQNGNNNQAPGGQPIVSPIPPGTYYPTGTMTIKLFANGSLIESQSEPVDPTPVIFGQTGLPLTTNNADIYNGYVETVSFAGSPSQFVVTAINTTADTLRVSYDLTLGVSFEGNSYQINGPVVEIYTVLPDGAVNATMSGTVGITVGSVLLSETINVAARLSKTPPPPPLVINEDPPPVVVPVVVTPTCGGSYYNALYGFGLDPLVGSIGPEVSSDTYIELFLSWDKLLGSSAIMSVAVGVFTATPSIDAWREHTLTFFPVGRSLLDDFYFEMSSGLKAWYHRDYNFSIGVFSAWVETVKNGRVYSMWVVYDDLFSDADALTILHTLDSFCVQP